MTISPEFASKFLETTHGWWTSSSSSSSSMVEEEEEVKEDDEDDERKTCLERKDDDDDDDDDPSSHNWVEDRNHTKNGVKKWLMLWMYSMENTNHMH